MTVTIFDALRAIQNSDMDFFLRLTAAEAKSISPYLLLLWTRHPLSQIPIRILATNECVNPFVFSLGRHPRLLYQLFCTAQSGSGFTKFLFDKKAVVDDETRIVADYEGIAPSRAKDRAARLPKERLFQMALELGWSEKELRGLRA